MTSSAKNQKPELSLAEECAVFLGARIQRQIVEWQSSGLYMVQPEVLADIRSLLICLADDCQTWPRSKWLLLDRLVRLCKAMQREAAGGRWDPPRLESSLTPIVQTCEAVAELLDPPPPPQERQIPLEPIQTLIAQNVGQAQIAKIFDWYTPDGTPDTARVARCQGGEEEAPKFKILPPLSSNVPKTPPNHFLLLGTSHDIQHTEGISRDEIIATVWAEKEAAERRRPAPGRRCPHDAAADHLVQIDEPHNADTNNDQVDLVVGEKIEQKRRPGRPRKSVSLEATRTG